MGKPALAVFSPLPPSRSGIADYCFEQLVPLSTDWDITVVIDDGAPEPTAPPGDVRVLREGEWQADPISRTPTARLYQCGNHPHHEFVLHEALTHPGVVVLHDYVLHHLVRSFTVGRGNLDGYRRYVECDLGRDAEEFVNHERLGLLSEQALFGVPLNGKLLAAATGVIVHSRVSLARIQDRFPALPAVRVPHHYSPPPVPIGTRWQERAGLGIAQDRIVISSLGFATPPKQVPLAIRAIGRLLGDHPNIEFVVVGEAPDTQELFDLAAVHGLTDRLRYTGFVSTEDFYRYVAASDVVVSLRYPSAGETSGTLIRAMGMGTCAIVFDFDSYKDYPDRVVIKIPLDTESPACLESALRRAVSSPAERETIARAAADHVRTEHQLERCAATYTEFLRAIAIDGSRAGSRST